MKNIDNCTREDFEKLKYREYGTDLEPFDSVIFLPTRRKHDSGYRIMEFIAVRKNKPICKLTGCSDVLHIEGIGGYGYNWLEKYGCCPDKIPPREWSIDCLYKSGLFRMFCHGYLIKASQPLSSLEIYSVEKR